MTIPHYRNPKPLDRDLIPEPVFDENPGLLDFYWLAWQQAWDHVVDKAGVPQSPYMDEGFDPDTIWIWDTCFMAHFCKYAPQLFPGIESFDNFYRPLHDGVASALRIQHLDNPPLLAWTEYTYLRHTGNGERIQRILGYLKKHFAFIENTKRGPSPYSIGRCPLSAERVEHGYLWNGVSSGMDNSPRADKSDMGEAPILWLDLLAQQALSALAIARLALTVGDQMTADEFGEKYQALKDLLNRYYWDEADGFYYDIRASAEPEPVRIKTPAAYWPMLAEVCDLRQAAALAKVAADPEGFGGEIPWPSVERRSPYYQPQGMYWRGGVWLPMAYMGAKALENYGYLDLANEMAFNLVQHMYRTYREYAPRTIWEVYSPEEPRPATAKDNVEISRPDFCGWSALGPISLFIENILGFYSVDALAGEVRWRKHRPGRHGLRRLRLGEASISILGEGAHVEVETTRPFTLVINDQRYAITMHRQAIELPPTSIGG